MTAFRPHRPQVIRAAAATAAALSLSLFLTPAAHASAAAGPSGQVTLPLGDPGLAETRSSRTLAPGVTLTSIVRGTEPASPDQINTTTKGPWAVNVLTIDPRRTDGHLTATYGPDLARTERTTDLVRQSGALVGVNASFFTFTASQQYPGDPVGLGLYGGRLLSEPTTDPAETSFVVDARTDRVLMGKLSWSGAVRNKQSGASLPLEFLNHPPVVPAGCATLPDPTACTAPGDVVRFTPEFAAATPSGAGVEVVLDRRGCVVRTERDRGTELAAGQTSLQATGRETATLLEVAGTGCLTVSSHLTDEDGKRVPVSESLSGVNGRYRLTEGGEIVVPSGSGSFFARNPRTIAGTTKDGKIVLATIDGRLTSSVGTTMNETAAVADALGLRDAVNLDGGGSSTLSVKGDLVNRPSGGTERLVGDALVFLEAPYRG
ncbi:phosphodiester glycosidase family protein [Streptomyces sp. NPDC059477]|uniref:phosphodiester glycosidase family protein n=1 Tax=Streptomyces sp. NPDC059477 TaxID=3346847 RepID=UPI0036BC0CE3